MPRNIVITGANRGIGLEMTRQAAAAGDRVVAICRDPSAFPEGTGAAEVLAADVTDEDALAAAAQAAGPVDLLVCNAGQLRGRGGVDADGYSAENWQASLMTNVAGPFLTVRAFHANLREAGGKIAVIASIMGSSARAPGGAYSYRASKAGAVNLAQNLAKDLAAEGIAVGAYHPGWVSTEMGGGGADLTPEESAAALLTRFDVLGMETTGVFEDYRGEAIPF